MKSYRQEGLKKFKQRRLPFIVAKCAQTVDGKIATSNGDSKWITSSKARSFSRLKRDQFDAILVGINTVLKDDPALNGYSKTKILKKIVLDAALKIPLNGKLFRGMPPASCIIATTKKAAASKIKYLREKGIIVVVCPAQEGRVDLNWLCRHLASNGILSILIEGGATVLGQALSLKLVDEMHIYIAPKILGDQNALSSVIGRKIKFVKQTIGLNFINIRRLGEDILIESHVLGNR